MYWSPPTFTTTFMLIGWYPLHSKSSSAPNNFVYINYRLLLKPWMPYDERDFEVILEPYMVISENVI